MLLKTVLSGEGKGVPKTGGNDNDKSLVGLSRFFPCSHYPGPEYSPSPTQSQTSLKNGFD